MAKNRGGTESLKRKIDLLNRIKTQTPRKAGNIIVKHFKNSFNIEGFEGDGIQKWQPRKGKWQGFSISKKSNRGRKTLTLKGNLKRSIYISWADWSRIEITSNLPYSAIHNYGLKGIAFGKYPFRMPQRRFIGKSRIMNRKVTDLLEKAINRAMRA
jgi:phage gpG-like protein